MAIIAAIVSMVYGSYFATIRSTEVHEAKMEVAQQMQQVLMQIARQLRCAYVPESLYTVQEQASSAAGASARQAKPISEQEKAVLEDTPNYFSGGADGLSDEVVRFVTTDASSAGVDSANGLFEVAYRFDGSRGLLLVSQCSFVRTLDATPSNRDWQPVLRGVEHFELTFFDGRKWLPKWDFKNKRRLPAAVRIDTTCEDRNDRRCRFMTVAHIPCQKNKGKKTTTDTSLSLGEQWDRGE